MLRAAGIVWLLSVIFLGCATTGVSNQHLQDKLIGGCWKAEPNKAGIKYLMFEHGNRCFLIYKDTGREDGKCSVNNNQINMILKDEVIEMGAGFEKDTLIIHYPDGDETIRLKRVDECRSGGGGGGESA